MRHDSSVFALWLRWSRSDRWIWIPLAVLLWGWGTLLLSYLAGNFWLERRPTAELSLVLTVDGGEAAKETVSSATQPKASSIPGGTQTNGVQVQAPKSEPALVGYIVHPNWSLWNAVFVPICVLLAVHLYRSTNFIARSLVRRGVVKLDGNDDASLAETKLRAYFEETQPWMELSLFFISTLVVVIHAWFDGSDFKTSLGFAQPQLYPAAYDFTKTSFPHQGLMNVFLIFAYAGTYFTVFLLAHFLIWSLFIYRRFGKLIPNLDPNDPEQVNGVAVDVAGERVIFLVKLQYRDADCRFGLESLQYVFDDVHWIAALCILLYPLMKVGVILREHNDTTQPASLVAFVFSVLGGMALFLLPILLTSEKIKQYKLALLDANRDDQEISDRIRQNKIWPAGSIAVSALLDVTLIALLLPIFEMMYINQVVHGVMVWGMYAATVFGAWLTAAGLGKFFQIGPLAQKPKND